MADDIQVSIEGDRVGNAREPTLKQREAAAEADLAAALAERAAAFAERDTATRELLAVQVEAIRGQEEAVEAQLREALEYSDADRIIKAQREMADITAKRQQLEHHQARMNVRPSDPVERYCQGRDQRSTAWLKAHPEFITDPRKNHKLRAADQDARAEGYDPSSDSYYSHVEKFVGLRGASDGDSVQSPRARQQSERPSPNKVTIRMTAEEKTRLQETAESLGIPFNEYLRRKYVMDNSPEWNWRQEFGG
jgi:hypothetical protein